MCELWLQSAVQTITQNHHIYVLKNVWLELQWLSLMSTELPANMRFKYTRGELYLVRHKCGSQLYQICKLNNCQWSSFRINLVANKVWKLQHRSKYNPFLTCEMTAKSFAVISCSVILHRHKQGKRPRCRVRDKEIQNILFIRQCFQTVLGVWKMLKFNEKNSSSVVINLRTHVKKLSVRKNIMHHSL